MRNSKIFRGAMLLAGSVLAAQAGQISVLNAGFENSVLADGGFVRGIPDWDIGAAFGPGVYNPETVSHPLEAPEGQNVGFTQAGKDVWQDLGAVLTANTAYTLQVDFGTPAGAPPFEVELELNVAGFHTLASFDGTVGEPFQNFTVHFAPGLSDPNLGQSLEILIHPVAGTDELDFDNVRLDATAVTAAPEPSTALPALALLIGALGAYRLRTLRVGLSRQYSPGSSALVSRQ